nr:MAG TPA: hypothetical protein [Bacteriophage sp.]
MSNNWKKTIKFAKTATSNNRIRQETWNSP